MLTVTPYPTPLCLSSRTVHRCRPHNRPGLVTMIVTSFPRTVFTASHCQSSPESLVSLYFTTGLFFTFLSQWPVVMVSRMLSPSLLLVLSLCSHRHDQTPHREKKPPQRCALVVPRLPASSAISPHRRSCFISR